MRYEVKLPSLGEDADERFHTLMDNILKWENA